MRRTLLTALLLISAFWICNAYAAGFLGVTLQPLTQELKESMGIEKELRGVLIADVEEDSPAEECGLKKGDVIIEIDNKPISKVREAIETIREHEAGDKVTIKILRDSTPLTLEAVLGERKDDDLRRMKRVTEKFKEIIPVYGGYLGVRVEPISRSLGEYFGVKEEEGVLVVEVIKDSPAEDAGLEPGDVILEIDGKKVSDPETLRRIIRKCEPGESVEIKYKRKNRIRTVKVELEKIHQRFDLDSFRRGHCPFSEIRPNPPRIPRVKVFRYYEGDRDYEIEPFAIEEFYDPMVIDEIRREIENLREQVEELREIVEDLRE